LAIGFGLFLRSLILSAARLAIGLIPIYLLVEYVFLEEGKRIIPWSAIARYSTNERKRLIAIETEGPQRISILWCCGQMIGVKRCKHFRDTARRRKSHPPPRSRCRLQGYDTKVLLRVVVTPFVGFRGPAEPQHVESERRRVGGVRVRLHDVTSEDAEYDAVAGSRTGPP
jgi:hypothetical protein